MRGNRYLNWFVYLMLLLTVGALTVNVSAQPRKKDIERARKLAKQGDQLFNQKNYRGAIDKYAEAITLFPPFPAAHFWKGYSHYYLNENDQAIADLSKAESLRFEKPLEIYRLRWLLNYQRQNYDDALADAIAAAKLAPNDATFSIAAGDIYRMKNSCTDAIPFYSKALAQDKKNSDVPYYLAVCYASLGKPTEQSEAAMEALGRQTKYVGESNFYVADAFRQQRDLDRAIEYYQKAIDIKPDFYPPYGALSDIYRSRNDFEKAIQVTQKGQIAFPKDAALSTSLAWYFSLADRPKEAIIAAKTAINLAPDQPMAFTNLCRAYNDDAQYQAAIATCTSALKLSPGDGETYLYMARAYEFLKQSDKALELYKKAVEGLLKATQDRPDYSDNYYLLGNAYFAIKKDKEAIEAYNTCLSLAPRFARARFSLGLTHIMLDQKDKAREQYEVLKTIDPTLAERLRKAIDSSK